MLTSTRPWQILYHARPSFLESVREGHEGEETERGNGDGGLGPPFRGIVLHEAVEGEGVAFQGGGVRARLVRIQVNLRGVLRKACLCLTSDQLVR